jgi:hypothetical protein
VNKNPAPKETAHMERSLVAWLMLVLGCSVRAAPPGEATAPPGDAAAPEEPDAASAGSPDRAVDVASDVGVAAADLAVDEAADAPPASRLAWWHEAKFGMFIHWGLYAVPAGQWNGKRVGGSAEWIMNNAKIPVKDYATLADTFNPVQFDAEAWVRIARSAGMKYIVFTAKHHEGFAMYPSKASPFNLAATAFKRDPVRELAEAAQARGHQVRDLLFAGGSTGISRVVLRRTCPGIPPRRATATSTCGLCPFRRCASCSPATRTWPCCGGTPRGE